MTSWLKFLLDHHREFAVRNFICPIVAVCCRRITNHGDVNWFFVVPLQLFQQFMNDWSNNELCNNACLCVFYVKPMWRPCTEFRVAESVRKLEWKTSHANRLKNCCKIVVVFVTISLQLTEKNFVTIGIQLPLRLLYMPLDRVIFFFGSGGRAGGREGGNTDGLLLIVEYPGAHPEHPLQQPCVGKTHTRTRTRTHTRTCTRTCTCTCTHTCTQAQHQKREEHAFQDLVEQGKIAERRHP